MAYFSRNFINKVKNTYDRVFRSSPSTSASYDTSTGIATAGKPSSSSSSTPQASTFSLGGGGSSSTSPTTPSTSSKSYGGGGGGSSSQAVQNLTKDIQNKTFSGKVEAYTGSELDKTTYYLSNRKTGSISGSYAESLPGVSRYTFYDKRTGKTRVTEFGKGGSTTTEKGDVYFIKERKIDTFRPKGSIQDIPITELVIVDRDGNIIRKANKEEESRYRQSPSLLAGRENLKGLEGFAQKLRRKQSEIETKEKGKGGFVTGATSMGLGALASLTGTAIAITKPKQTITSAYEFSKSVLKDPSVIKSSFKQIGKQAQRSPSYVVGFTASEYAQFKLPTLIVKGTDIIRVRGLKKLPTEKIVAPEFFKGQTFPTIKKGQTAGSLLKEFTKEELSGFTASPKPFSKVTKAGKGSSELEGVYQAPKLSPQFLRISGEEEKLFRFGFKQTFRPSILKIKPLEFKLTPLVKKGQKGLAPLKKTQEFFKSAEKGKSYVPFIKTEKEAVIPFDTELRQTGKNYFIKFEGRRIPIFEFEALKSGELIKEVSKTKQAGELSKSLSSSRVGEKSLFGIEDISRVKKSSYSKSPSSSIKNYASSSLKSKASKSYTKSSTKKSLPKSSVKSYVSSIKSLISKRYSGSRSYTSSMRTPPPSSPVTPFKTPRTFPPLKNRFRLPKTKKKKKKLVEDKTFRDSLVYTPDYTSLTLKLKRKVSREDLFKEARKGGGRLGLRPLPILMKGGRSSFRKKSKKILNAIR